MPPSANILYGTNWYTKQRKKSEKYKQYEIEVYHWEFLNKQRVIRIRNQVKKWVTDPLRLIKLHCYFAFHRKRLVTKKEVLKSLDASNYLKACHDTLVDILRVDDARYSMGEVDKVYVDNPKDECAFIVMVPSKLRSLDVIKGIWHKD